MIAQAPRELLSEFQWQPQPQAEALVASWLDDFLKRCPGAATLARRMRDETGSRIFDWIDYIALSRPNGTENDLKDAGFALRPCEGADRRYIHEAGMFPAIVLRRDEPDEIGIRVDSVVDFAAAHVIELGAQFSAGRPMGMLRRLLAFTGDGTELYVIERHGWRGMNTPVQTDHQRIGMLRHLEKFRTRPRDFAHDEDGFACLERTIDEAIAELGRDVACDLFFIAEREYWQRRNHAAQVQKARQDRLGLGWANHDHHTYRSSRRHFRRLISVFEQLGLTCRERFYAGTQAGWGAQVMENPQAGIVVFADVDLSPDELMGDFAHEDLAERGQLDTAGLWCALHGEAILQAGMHHLECQFDFESLRSQLEESEGVHMMKPFTDTPWLRQAFTEGQRWPVCDERLNRLLARGQITGEQAHQFREQGAIGSHLENLQRNAGYKGFNQQGVGEIMARTDPRKNVVSRGV